MFRSYIDSGVINFKENDLQGQCDMSNTTDFDAG